MQIRDLGLIEYEAGLRQQTEAVLRVQDKGPEAEVIFVCEHPAVITVGRAPGSVQEVFAKDLPVVEVSRGGRATLHLPGQVVIYPIIDLEKRGRDLHGYMRVLEDAVINTLADFRIQAQRVEGKTGVWVGGGAGEDFRKIASIGIAVQKHVSLHGLALNVSCDLKLFSKLSPCGFEPRVMTSVLEELKDSYKKTWGLSPENLFKRIKTRLTENVAESLEAWHPSLQEDHH